MDATNKVFEEKGLTLPLEGQATTTPENRRELGTQAQVDIFGEGMKDYWKSGPEESRHINYWLADNCFGDYYTRTGLDYAQREMITFCFIAAQGGCEPQLTSHASANMNVGNDKKFLIKVISQCLPFIGYPRSLNALACVIGLSLNYDQAIDLLQRAGLTLSKYYETDLIVEYFIREKNYDIDEINALLYQKDLSLLGTY